MARKSVIFLKKFGCLHSVERLDSREGFHVLSARICAGVLGRGAAALHFHFSGAPIEPAFVTLALRATPYNPVAFAMAGAVVGFFREAVERDFAHERSLCGVKNWKKGRCLST